MKYLYEYMEEYRESDNPESVVEEFLNEVWNCPINYSTKERSFSFWVSESALENYPELIAFFKQHNKIKFHMCNSFHRTRNGIELIRIPINNNYAFLTSKDVYLGRTYYKLLKTPKNEYFSVLEKIKQGEVIDVFEIMNRVEAALERAVKLKEERLAEKFDISWEEYKEIVNTYVHRLFKNYKSQEEYEDELEDDYYQLVNAITNNENNRIVKYFRKSLRGYSMNYRRDRKPKVIKLKSCELCKIKFESNSNRQLFCDNCKAERRRVKRITYNRNGYLKRKKSN